MKTKLGIFLLLMAIGIGFAAKPDPKEDLVSLLHHANGCAFKAGVYSAMHAYVRHEPTNTVQWAELALNFFTNQNPAFVTNSVFLKYAK